MTTRSAMSTRSHRRTPTLLALGAIGSLVTVTALPAQLISIKSVPIAEGDQFAVFPSRNLGMGGVSIALDDSLADPFRNPATGSRVRGAHLIGSPVLYDISSGAGGGRTLPMGLLARSGAWFGAASLAAQEIDELAVDPSFRVAQPDFASSVAEPGPATVLDGESRHNTYALGLIGRAFPESRLAFAASVQWAGLNVVDGVELLYAGSQDLRQRGRALDVRVGLLKEWEGDRSMQAVVVHNRYRMTHDVTYIDQAWDPVEQRFEPQERLEHNPDRTNTWGLHLRYARPIADTSGWRLGAIATANRMSHPKIPNYEIMSIPRDPGYSYAYNFGIGLARTTGLATLAMEVVYEPIWSDTWADAAQPVQASDGTIIPAGAKTIENDFTFSNIAGRMGVSRDVPLNENGAVAGIQLGLALRSIHYWLAQQDNVQGTRRGLEERWLEWTPTWGMSLRFPELEVRYTARQTNGTGRPFVAGGGPEPQPGFADVQSSGRSVIVAPSGPLRLDEVHVVTHQISISFLLW